MYMQTEVRYYLKRQVMSITVLSDRFRLIWTELSATYVKIQYWDQKCDISDEFWNCFNYSNV